MRKRVYVSIFSIVVTAALSAVILWRTLMGENIMGQFGLVGIFLVSMLTHLTVVARDMFLPMFLSLTTIYGPLQLGAAAGWGGAVGEVTTYLLGWAIADSVQGEQSHSEGLITRWMRKYGILAVLLVSMTPLPDTPLVLLAGSNKLSLKRMLVVEGIGKTVLYTLGAVLGGFFFTELTGRVGGIAAHALTVAASIAFCLLVTLRRSRDTIFGWVERLIISR